MSRTYTQLACGCEISCDDGGGLMPCENYTVCDSFRYIEKHKFCKICEECIVCYDHINCTFYPGGVE